MHRNKTILRTLAALAASLLSTFALNSQAGFGSAEKFNDGWKFHLEPSEKAGLGQDSAPAAESAACPAPAAESAVCPAPEQDFASLDFDDSSWRKLDLPHDWSIEGLMSPSLASCTGYLPGGIGWYRKHFSISDLNQKYFIYFEGVYNRSEVYLNGELLGKRPNGYISFMYELSGKLKEGDNVLAVKVDHSRFADSRWYTGSGIYRDVWLVRSGDLHFALWGVSWTADMGKSHISAGADAAAGPAILNVSAEIVSPGVRNVVLRSWLEDADGARVAAANSGKRVIGTRSVCDTLTLSMRVRNPMLWDLDAPYLYTLRTELVADGKVVDSNTCRVGFRTLEFDADKGFALNSRSMKVKGVCLHHDAGVLGAAVPEEVWERRLRELKSLGVNAIRCSHNPQAPMLYELCDELGFLVMDEASDEWEFPKRKWLEGWNVGTPGYQGSYDFFEEWIERDVTDMVRRDRNHPCIFLWSIGNEVDYPNDPYSHPVLDGSTINQPMFGGYRPDAPDASRIGAIAQRLAACVRRADSSRPVTGALAGVVMSNETAYPEAVDVVGYNYTEDRYDLDHSTYPERVIYGSENGMSYSAWKAVTDRDFIFGQFVWTGLDYLGESNSWPSRGLYTGLLDYAGIRKPRGWFRASLWSDTKTTYIGTYPKRDQLSIDAYDSWNYSPGEQIRVVCYTNSPQARLLLDGKPYGEMKAYDSESGIIYWDVEYREGELKAQGCSAEGVPESEYSITTSARPYELKAKLLDGNHAAGSVVQVLVEVFDEYGVKVLLSDNEIKCKLTGEATLLGLESGSNTDMSDHRDSVQRAYRGNLLAYVRLEGPAEISFSSPLLKSCQLRLKPASE